MIKGHILSNQGFAHLKEMYEWWLHNRHKTNIQSPSRRRPPGEGGGGTSDQVHQAFCKAAAGASAAITCFLDTDGTGTEITVNCSIIGATTLDDAYPRLVDGSKIFVIQISTSWYCVSPFIGSQQIIDLVKTMFDECA